KTGPSPTENEGGEAVVTMIYVMLGSSLLAHQPWTSLRVGSAAAAYLSWGRILCQASASSWDAFSKEVLAPPPPSAPTVCNFRDAASALVQVLFRSFSAALPASFPLAAALSLKSCIF